jgi:hypothetical protein
MMSRGDLARVVVALTVFAAAAAPGSAMAGMLFSASSGNLSASANFQLSGNTLTLTLTNTSTADVLVPTDVLTGVFFNVAPSHTLTPLSASLNGSTLCYGSPIHDIGEGWQYEAFATAAAQGKDAGISATGLGIFGPNGNFYHPSSGSNPNLGGLNYAILSAGDNPATGNAGVTGKGPLVKDSIAFTLSTAGGFTLADLGNSVVFQYGTSLTETHFSALPVPPITPGITPVPTPEPASVVIWTLGIAGLIMRRRTKTA